MSKSLNNPIVQNASGMLGDTVVFRKVNGKMQIANKPAPRKMNSENQHVVQSKFSRAARYAKKQLGIQEAREMYAARVTDRLTTPFVVAMTDFLTPPKIHSVDTSDYLGAIGDPIAVEASDDFMVKAVRVIITQPDGTRLEDGEAVPDPDREDFWVYNATAVNNDVPGTTISAIVTDRPGNKATEVVEL
jgi:hypothetical protein